MKIIVCVDDAMGMMFNRRRQSQDAVLRKKILEECRPHRLWMNAYSGKQFDDCPKEQIAVDEAFMEKAGEDEYCFVENVNPAAYEKDVEEVILYKWNRRYPSDLKFNIPLEKKGFTMTDCEEFAGSSHEKITKEVYKR